MGVVSPTMLYSALDQSRATPGRNSLTTEAMHTLDAGFDKYVDKISPGRKPVLDINLEPGQPGLKGAYDSLSDPNKYASSGTKKANGRYGININPHADRAYFAHELGHVAAQQTDVGHLISAARSNPKVGRALMLAAVLGSTGTAALTPGDEDLATSVGLAYASQLPTILDEIQGTRHGLGIMDTAGMRANLGQRGKLASNLLNYLGAPLLLGVTANAAGNLVDEDVPYMPS